MSASAFCPAGYKIPNQFLELQKHLRFNEIETIFYNSQHMFTTVHIPWK